MILSRFSTIFYNSGSNLQNGLLGVSFHSTATRKPWRGSMYNLYRRISPMGDPKVSIVPILDQWVDEGREVDNEQLQVFIKELKYYKRYTHALELSMWMSDKRYFKITSRDVAVRLDLISKVHGIEQVENYFNNVPKQLRLLEVYAALLNCYARAKSVQKAEAVMQELKDLGLARTSLAYNVLLNLYYQTGNYEKLDNLMHEMEAEGIHFDKYTFGIRFSAYAAASDTEGMDKILTRMESDPKVVLDWTAYSAFANGYTKAGLLDKALVLLKKSEGLVTGKKRSTAYNFLLTQYAATGKKDEVLRLWEVYKKKEKVFNNGHISMITSLLKFDDIESAEKIFEEWESQNLAYDIRIPNYLIGACCRKGLMEKAETLLNRVISKGGKPDAKSWYYLATGHLQNNQTLKAVDAMKEAIIVCWPGWKPSKESLVACLEYLKREGDVKGAEELIRLLRDRDIVSVDVQDRLLNFIKDEKSKLDALVGNEETLGISDLEEDSSN